MNFIDQTSVRASKCYHDFIHRWIEYGITIGNIHLVASQPSRSQNIWLLGFNLSHIIGFGVKDGALDWMISYPGNRRARVTIDEAFLKLISLTSGVINSPKRALTVHKAPRCSMKPQWSGVPFLCG